MLLSFSNTALCLKQIFLVVRSQVWTCCWTQSMNVNQTLPSVDEDWNNMTPQNDEREPTECKYGGREMRGANRCHSLIPGRQRGTRRRASVAMVTASHRFCWLQPVLWLPACYSPWSISLTCVCVCVWIYPPELMFMNATDNLMVHV